MASDGGLGLWAWGSGFKVQGLLPPRLCTLNPHRKRKCKVLPDTVNRFMGLPYTINRFMVLPFTIDHT